MSPGMLERALDAAGKRCDDLDRRLAHATRKRVWKERRGDNTESVRVEISALFEESERARRRWARFFSVYHQRLGKGTRP